MNDPTPSGQTRQRMLTLASGGWLIILAVLLVVAVTAWRLTPILLSGGDRAIGDGSDPATYGFELENLTLDRSALAASGVPRDGLPVLDDPPTMAGGQIVAFNETHRGKYLVSADRVIGVVLGGEARAYPVRVLNWHEVVNDTLGGVPVLVTFHPLCDSAAVYHRQLGDRRFRFGHSGLFWSSNLLLYDRDETVPSLWSQILGTAVAGPAADAGLRLERIPAALTRWDLWLRDHPDTSVLRPDDALLERYRRDPYGNYLLTGAPRFPVVPPPPADGPPAMTAVVGIDDGATGRAALVESWSGASGPIPGTAGDALIDARDTPPSLVVDPAGGAAPVPALWFAWHAYRPDSELVRHEP